MIKLVDYTLDEIAVMEIENEDDAEELRADIYNWFDIWAIIETYKNNSGKTVHRLNLTYYNN